MGSTNWRYGALCPFCRSVLLPNQCAQCGADASSIMRRFAEIQEAEAKRQAQEERWAAESVESQAAERRGELVGNTIAAIFILAVLGLVGGILYDIFF